VHVVAVLKSEWLPSGRASMQHCAAFCVTSALQQLLRRVKCADNAVLA
jgi:hypothetical protein